MKFVKHLALMAIAAVAAIALGGCDNQEEQTENPNLNHDLTLSVDVEDITSTTAKVKVSHNGSTADTWLGFVTAEVDKSEKALIDEAALAFLASSDVAQLRASKSYVTILKDLTPATTYKYIAFGLSEKGEVYGGYGVFEFTTAEGGNGGGNGGGGNTGGGGGTSGMRVNEAWSVSYLGAGTLYDQQFDHIVKVTSTDHNPYLLTAVYASEWDPEGLLELGSYLVTDLRNYLTEFNSANGTSYTLADMLFVGDGYDAFNLNPGYYKAVALGVNEQGTLTGLYAVSETFEVKEQVATGNFKAWLGNWEVVGNNGVSYTINLSNGLANKFFYMSYWENDPDFMVKVDYNASLDALFFYAQQVAEDVNFGEAGIGDVYFLGLDDEGGMYTIEAGEYGIGIAGILDGGQRALVRYDDDSVQGYPFFDFMFFVADIDGKYYRLTNADLLEMPAAINPAGGQVAVAPVARPTARQNLYTKAVRPAKVYTPGEEIFNFAR